jgi:hypothetical protein
MVYLQRTDFGMLLRFAADRLSASAEKSDDPGVSAGAN